MKRSAANLFELAVIAAMALFALAVMAWLIAAPAHAQAMCGDRAGIIKVLGDKYHEVPTHYGIAGSNLYELYVSTTGSFTMLITIAKGPTCIIGAGKDWHEIIPAAKMGEPS